MKLPSVYSPIQLSKEAIDELKEVLKKEIGSSAFRRLSEKEINHIGFFLLTLTSIQDNIRIREYQQ